MASRVKELLHLSVPDHLRAEVTDLIESSITADEGSPYRSSWRGRGSVKKQGLYVGIARVIMDVWSEEMRRHVEGLILRKAVQEQYLENRHLKFVHVLHDEDEVPGEGQNWLINDHDDAMVDLVWNVLNMKQHFEETRTHRLWVQRSFERLSNFVPELHPEIVERHDLSKFAFSQAVGYTLKWVHNIAGAIWTSACNLHLNNEPHHPQMWSSVHTPREKRRKLEIWTKDVCDFHQGNPYGISLSTLSLRSEELALPFLLESYIDMVAVEWERKKGKSLEISDVDLSFIHERFLQRYIPRQRTILNELMQRIQETSETSLGSTSSVR